METTNLCEHPKLECINEFEMIRKYQCAECGAVAMCACNEVVAKAFLPHQLRHGTGLTTGKRILVTEGFRPRICAECRGLPIRARPLAEIYGRTSKLERYYWREIALRRMEISLELFRETGLTELTTVPPELAARASTQALAEIRVLHSTQPKYVFADEPQSSVLQRYNVDILHLRAEYAAITTGKALIEDFDEAISAEDYVSRIFERQGYSVLMLESRPFHVLFGIYMWLLVQDYRDPLGRMVSFGSRTVVDKGGPAELIWTQLPEDFGKSGFADRRGPEIDEHLKDLEQPGELKWLFDYWLEPSEMLRQYLWAHRDEDVERARVLIRVLPAQTVVNILRFLVGDYWHRYLGWPDLIIYKESEFRLIEVKTSADRLSEAQKNWIRGNHEILHLPFTLAKLHRASPRPR